MIILLLAGFALRLTIAYVLLPSSGFETDIASYASWALSLAEHGPSGFYANAGFSDYPPAYLYLLWPIGAFAQAATDPGATASGLVKLPPMIIDIVVGYVVYRLVRGWTWPGTGSERLALLASALYVFNPVTIYDSAVWGQSDAAGALVLLLGVAALIRGNSEGAAAMAALAALVKPQFGLVLIPLVAFVLVKRHLVRAGSGPRHAPWAPSRVAAWLGTHQGPERLATALVAALGVFFALALPFGMGPLEYLSRMAATAGGYAYLTVNAFNAWALLGSGGGPSLAESMTWSSDTVPLVGPVPGVAIGAALLVGGFLWGTVRAAVRDDRWTLLVATVFLATAFFILPTRVHERYLFPVFAFLPLLAVVERRWLIALVLMAGAAIVNLHAILTSSRYGTDSVVALPLGEWFRSPGMVSLAAIVVTGVGLWVAWQLRPSLRTSPDGFVRAAADGRLTADGRLAHAVTDGVRVAGTGPGWLDSMVGRLTRPPLRADRSASLAGERGGRLDWRDLLIALGIVVLAVVIRGYRLDQPVGMYFDEVYHARTATEFLQDWEYDQPHAIYEFTHPHLAKYAMAWGIRLAGDNAVHGSSALGTPVVSAAIERRWAPGLSSTPRRGDRLYVATGEDVRAYDLASRELEAVVPMAATALAVDGIDHRLYLADRDGSLHVLDTSVLDERRTSGAEADAGTSLEEGLTALSAGPGSPVDRLVVTDGSLVAVGEGAISSFDPESGSLLSERFAFDTADVIELPAAERLVIDTLAVTDRDVTAERLAGLLLGEDPATDGSIDEAENAGADDATALEAERLRRLFEHDGIVVAEAYLSDDVEGRIRAAIEAGELPGTSLESGRLLAATDLSGVAVLDARTLDQVTHVELDAPPSALVTVEDGLPEPTLYAAAGTDLAIVPIGAEGPGVTTILPMPGELRDLVWNEPANLVHALGDAPDGAGMTVYAVEPHGNAVFVDVPLPVDATLLLADTQPERPGDDRGELLALDDGGSIVRVGSDGNAFGWRLPGMLLGALAAGLLYLLARVLFARRSVGLIAGVLVLAEGMMFANSRIAMNDVYVTTFLIAAALLFSPLYLGPRRPWTAIVLLVGAGLALGLALASKWVALYAIGGLVLLVLLRSALGRVIALIGMVGMTALLGAMAVRAADVEMPHRNWPFLGLMLLLTALLAAGIVRRPLPFTRGEVRLAVAGPVVVGIVLLVAGSRALGDAGTAVTDDGALTPAGLLLAAGALAIAVGVVVAVVALLATRRGHGPFARETSQVPGARPGPPAETARVAAPAGPPDEAVSPWLHPGRLFGLPWLFTLTCLIVVPIGIYIVSYAPWIELGNQWGLPLIARLPFMPAGDETGRTLLDLTRSMYEYHDNLRAAHAASSPWWAWPLDLKPVWWFSETYAGDTSAYIYDAGNLVVFWMGIAGVAFGAWAAWTRRSLSLAIVVILWLSLWLPWARIDRATFQYHVYASLPFLVVALAYFLAELWHGPSARVWLLARVTAALAILGPPLLWLLRTPLCSLAGTEAAHPDGAACAAQVTRTAQISEASTAALAVLAVGASLAALIGWWSARPTWRARPAGKRTRASHTASSGPVLTLVVVASLTFVGVVGALSFLDTSSPTPLTLTSDQLALIGMLALGVPAVIVLRARDPRRFVLGVLGAAVLWLLLWYPNLAALPLPSSIASLYQGLLPTWLWDFQFAVNMDPAIEGGMVDAGTIVVGATAALLVAGAALAARWWGDVGTRESDEAALGAALS